MRFAQSQSAYCLSVSERNDRAIVNCIKCGANLSYFARNYKKNDSASQYCRYEKISVFL